MTTQNNPHADIVDLIMAYEEGNTTEEQTLTLFQHLVDTGAAWHMQGHYGRTAANLLKLGLITEKPAFSPTGRKEDTTS